MNDDEAWLLEHGYFVEVEEEPPGIYWANLVNRENPKGRVRNYGRGDSPDSAIRRARDRFDVEQIGGAP